MHVTGARGIVMSILRVAYDSTMRVVESKAKGGALILRGINAMVRCCCFACVVFLAALVVPAPPHEHLQTTVATSARRSGCDVKVSGGGGALERAVNNRNPGTTFCIRRGKYSVSNRGLKLQDGDVLNGAGRVHPGRGGRRPRVRIVGRGTDVIFGGDKVRLLDISVTDPAKNSGCSSSTGCGQTVKPGNNWRIKRVRIHHADAQCIGSAGHSLVILDSEIDHCGNRFDGKNQNGFAGGIKAGVNGAYTIRKSYVHNNNQGVWCDVDCSSQHMPFTVINNRILNNYSFGVHYEHTTMKASTPARAIIKDNVVRGNNWGRFRTKADIGVMSAQNAQVRSNKVGATRAHPRKGNGIVFRNTDGRGSASGTASGNRMGGDSLKGCRLSGVVCK
jgi:hypothetical protein